MRILLTAAIPTLVLGDACQDLCERDGKSVCTNGSYDNNGVCHSYFFRSAPPTSDYCYLSKSCPPTHWPVTVEDASKILAGSTADPETTTTTESGPSEDYLADDVSRTLGSITGVRRPWRSHPKAWAENHVIDLELYVENDHQIEHKEDFWKKAKVNDFIGILSKVGDSDDEFVIELMTRIITAINVPQDSRPAMGESTGFCARLRSNLLVSFVNLMYAEQVVRDFCPSLFTESAPFKRVDVVEAVRGNSSPSLKIDVSRHNVWQDSQEVLLSDPAFLKAGIQSVKFKEDQYASVSEWISMLAEALMKVETGVLVPIGSTFELPEEGPTDQFRAFGRFLATVFLEGHPSGLPMDSAFWASLMGTSASASAPMTAVKTGFNEVIPHSSIGSLSVGDFAGFISGVALDTTNPTQLLSLIQFDGYMQVMDDDEFDFTAETKAQFERIGYAVHDMDASHIHSLYRVVTGSNVLPYFGVSGYPPLMTVRVLQDQSGIDLTARTLNLASQPDGADMYKYLTTMIEDAIKKRNV